MEAKSETLKSNLNVLFKRQDLDILLKAKINNTMLLDAGQFLLRARYLLKKEDSTSVNWYSKIYVDLIMSVESSMKSIIVSLSKSDETPEKVYDLVREKGHRIEQLYIEVEKRAKNRLKLLSKNKREDLLNNFTKINISNRYHLVTFLKIRKDINNRIINVNNNSKPIRYLLTQKSLIKLEGITKDLYRISIKASKRTPPILTRGENTNDFFKRIDEFCDGIKRL